MRTIYGPTKFTEYPMTITRLMDIIGASLSAKPFQAKTVNIGYFIARRPIP
jgi:hypothetical protein